MSNSHASPTTAGLQDVRDTAVTSVGGQNYKSNVNYVFTDHGVVGSAVNVIEDTLELLTGESENNRQFLGQGVSKVIDQADRNQGLIASAAGAVAKFLGKEQEANRNFLGQGVSELIDQAESYVAAARQSEANTLEFARSESDANRQFLGQATTYTTDALQGGFASFLESIGTTIDDTFHLVGGSQSLLAANQADTIDTLTEFTTSFLTSSDQRNNANVEVLTNAARSDAAKALDKIIYLAGGTMALFALITVMKK